VGVLVIVAQAVAAAVDLSKGQPGISSCVGPMSSANSLRFQMVSKIEITSRAASSGVALQEG